MTGFVTDVKEAARKNDYFRKVLFTAPKSQLVLMSIAPFEEIGIEVHDGDQILYVVEGEGEVVMEGSTKNIEKGTLIFVPAGVSHNVFNTDDEPLKLFTVYAPPQHATGAVQRTREEAEHKKPAEVALR